MREDFLPFSRPCLGKEEIHEVVECLNSGWITTGPRCQEFEKDFAAYVGAKHAVALSSCTAGLHLAFLALGLGEGDEVVTSPMTFAATVNMIYLCGAKPVLADIDVRTRQVLIDEIEAKITPRTKAVVPVHFAGSACDLQAIEALARQHGLLVVEDAAHAVGTRYRGKLIGSGDNPAAFSFHPIKNMTTGEGGMLVTNDDDLAEQVRVLKFHGIAKDAWKRYAADGVSQYDVLRPGFKYNMMDIQAALGIHQLRRLDDFIRQRTEQARYYDQHLAEIDEIGLPGMPPYPVRHAWHLYTVLVKVETLAINRDEFMNELKRRNIGTGLHFKAIHLHPFYARELQLSRGSLPNAEYVSDRIVSLPLFPRLERNDQDDVIEAIKDVIHAARK